VRMRSVLRFMRLSPSKRPSSHPLMSILSILRYWALRACLEDVAGVPDKRAATTARSLAAYAKMPYSVKS
jgi:hypothetical protein